MKTCLIVDDSAVIRKVARRILEGMNFKVGEAEDGAKALVLCAEAMPDVILLDWNMPEMDGYEATAAIRARETNGQRIPIIAMTAHALEGERAKCLAAGMDDYLSKPVNIEELEKVLGTWLSVASASMVEANASETLERDHSPPVDLERLYLAMGDEPEELQEMLDIYLEQMEDSLKKLNAAIGDGDASGIVSITHNCAGVSANCGMTAVVASLQELERMGRESKLSGAAQVGAEVEREFRRIKHFLQEQFKQLVSNPRIDSLPQPN